MTINALKVVDFASGQVTADKLEIADIANFQVSGSVPYVLSWQLLKRRTGSAKTKLMSEISGTTAKPYKQKGTGHARQGSKRSVQFRGGRACFGPLPRDFGFSIPKKIVQKALADAIKVKIKDNKLVLFNKLDTKLKTSQAYKLLLGNNINSALVVFDKTEEGFDPAKIFGNIKNVKPIAYQGLNVYDLLKFDFFVLEKGLFQQIKEVIK